ncbi:MAG: hypothetical protein NVS9B9_23990 [Ktedonobacteraceae bacterium]
MVYGVATGALLEVAIGALGTGGFTGVPFCATDVIEATGASGARGILGVSGALFVSITLSFATGVPGVAVLPAWMTLLAL